MAWIENGAGDPSGGVLRERDLRVVPAVDVERLLRQGRNDHRLARLKLEERTAADGLDDELALIHPHIEECPAGLAHEGKVGLCRLILALDLQPGGTAHRPAEPTDHLIERKARKGRVVDMRDHVACGDPRSCRRRAIERLQNLGAALLGAYVHADAAIAHVASSLGGAKSYRPAYAASMSGATFGGADGSINAVCSGTLARIASHITSLAIAPRVALSRALSSDSCVEAANSASPSSWVENGWMPRLIEVWTCTASRCSCQGTSFWLVTTRLIVVFCVVPASQSGLRLAGRWPRS